MTAAPRALAGALALVMLAGACGDDDAPITAGGGSVETFVVPSRLHTDQPVRYPQNPPVAGDHAPAWQNCGFYSEPIPNELGVHSLEHGAVWITYRPDLAARDVDLLAGLAADGYVLVSPNDTLTQPIVTSAWGVQAHAESASDPTLVTFVESYRQGAQTPEPGAPCTGGVGIPQR